MDSIDQIANKVITECGHSFHCSCLMKNAVHNGFGCPYCRTTMAEEPEFSEEDDEDEQYEEYEDDDDDEDIELNPPIDLIIEKLKEQQIPYETLIRAYCFDEFFTTSQDEQIICREAYDNMFNNISNIVYKYRIDMAEIEFNETMISQPDVAETKNKNNIQELYYECY
jgi:hypothetical protein